MLGLAHENIGLIQSPRSYMWPRPDALPLRIPFEATSESSFEQASRRKAVLRGSDNVLRFVDALPNGVLLLAGKDGPGFPSGMEISNKLLRFHRYAYFYDPRSGDIYSFSEFSFVSGKNGHGYHSTVLQKEKNP